MSRELRPEDIDLSDIIRPGDTVLWGQGPAEPLTLTRALVAQRRQLGGVRVFLGMSLSDTLSPSHADHLSFVGLGGVGTNRRLASAGVIEVLPCHLSKLPEYISDGTVRIDVVFLLLSPPDATGRYSFGVSNDYLQPAIKRARVVVAEVNDLVPWTFGEGHVSQEEIHYVVRTSRPLLEMPPSQITSTERAIARHAAAFIPDGAVLQVGIGAIPEAILAELFDRKHLGIHSGMIGDRVLDLIEAGVVTNASKPIDRGVTTTGLLLGTRRLFDFAHRNPAVCMRPVTYTHDQRVISRFETFISINSAVEVDLTGQVNAELIGGKYVGAVGGQADFVRGANASPNGRSIIALPATAQDGAVSRIVPRLPGGVVTTPRSDVDIVVTEFGAAQLRGRTLSERAEQMIAIASPAFRDRLREEARAIVGASR